jgi:hypothetical protein
MSARKKYRLAPGWRGRDTPPVALSTRCPRCGRHLRVTSAKKLLAGKLDAKVFTACGCSWGMYQPCKDERAELLTRCEKLTD